MKKVFLVFLLSITLSAEHFNFAYADAALSQYSKKDTIITMDVWVQELIKDMKHTISFNFYDDPMEMASKFKDKKLDIVWTSGLDLVKYYKKSELVDGFSAGNANRKLENLILVVPKESSESDFKALKEPIISLQAKEEIAKIYIKNYFLKYSQRDQINFLETRKRNTALLKVFFKQADAAIVTLATFNLAKELNPQIGTHLKVLESTNISAGTFGFYRKGIEEKFRTALFNSAKEVIQEERGQQVLAIFQMDSVIKTDAQDLEPIENLYNEYMSLTKNKREN